MSEIILEPFWSKSTRKSVGRDHLGLQRISQSLYGELVPGLTNLTKRMRYYSFYSWIIATFEELHYTKPLSFFKNYMRRSEFLYALAVIEFDDGHNIRHIPGKDFVDKLRKSNNLIAGKTVNFKEFADNNKQNKTYWTYSSGAFGQYYSSSLVNIGLINYNKFGIPVLTDSGKYLANSFSINIPEQIKNEFLDCVGEGVIKFDRLYDIGSFFDPLKVGDNNQERQTFDVLLLNEKHINRKSTIELLLRYIESNNGINDDKDFPKAIYYDRNKNNDTRIVSESYNVMCEAWYFFQINEFIHYSLETIFHDLLKLLRNESGWNDIDVIIKTVEKNTVQDLSTVLSELKLINGDGLVGVITNVLKQYEDKVWDEEGSIDWFIVKCNKISNCSLSAAFLLLIILLNKHNDEVKMLIKSNPLINKINTSDLSDVLKSLDNYNEMLLSDFIRKVVMLIINRHLMVGYRKLVHENIDTLKFQVENNQIQGLFIIDPQFTNPRLDSLLNFLTDLKIIDTNYNLIRTL